MLAPQLHACVLEKAAVLTACNFNALWMAGPQNKDGRDDKIKICAFIGRINGSWFNYWLLMNSIAKSCMRWFIRADAALSKMMDAWADMLHVHLRPPWPHKSSLLRDRMVVRKMRCGANDFRPDFSISDAFPWVHVENKSNGLSERSNRRAATVACEEVCSKTPPDTGAYYLDWHRLLQLISADMRRPEQLQEVLYPSHTLINKHQHTHTQHCYKGQESSSVENCFL